MHEIFKNNMKTVIFDKIIYSVKQNSIKLIQKHDIYGEKHD